MLKKESPEFEKNAREAFSPVMLHSLGHHLIGPAIGRGTFSTTYRATRNNLACAIKRLDKDKFEDAEAVRYVPAFCTSVAP